MKTLVTIGTVKETKFTRLFKMIDDLCEEGVLKGKDVIAQVGFDQYHSKYYSCFEMIDNDEFKNLISQSDLIISHSGTGTVTTCVKQHKKVIVVPRLTKFNEHFDDHQLELAELFRKQNYVEVATNLDELRNLILNIDSFNPSIYKSNNKLINSLIIDFIEGKKDI